MDAFRTAYVYIRNVLQESFAKQMRGIRSPMTSSI